MASRPILGGFGPDSSQPQAPVARKGGIMPGTTFDVMGYSPPYGPKGITDPQNPGIHGTNLGNKNDPDNADSRTGTPMAGAKNRGNCGSQGRY
jgi:hypothetical protein